jgi:uncharacterized protein
VVADTELARQYAEEPFPLIDYDSYLALVVDFLERLNPSIRLERLFGLAPEDQLVAPHWGKTKAEIQYGIECTLEARSTWQGRLYRL